MTDNRPGLIVIVSDDLRPDEVEAVASAIRLLRGVVSVEAAAMSPELQDARERVDAEWRHRIVGLLDDEGV
jgi:hypothetical protein